jgi:hypothetical protein
VKKHQRLLRVCVVAILVMMAPACETQDREDDIEFVSLASTIIPQYDEMGEVIFVAAIRVKTYSGTNVIGKFSLNSLERISNIDVSASNGQWRDIQLSAADHTPVPGTYEVKVVCTLSSNGKTVTGTATLVVD